jgi:hypothetical protein
MKRVSAITATLLLIAVMPAIVVVTRHGWSEAQRFHPEQFKAAATRGDLDEAEDEAYAAVDQHALRGLSRERVRMLLGKRDRIAGRSHTYVWDLGMINDAMGPGDQGAFRVRFDSTWEHVVSVAVE